MRKHPEVFALLFLALVWSIGSRVIHARGEMNRVIVLNGLDHALIERLEDCPVEKMQALRVRVRDRVQTRVHDRVRDEVRSAADELRDALRSLQ